jgi:hypothetical protein
MGTTGESVHAQRKKIAKNGEPMHRGYLIMDILDCPLELHEKVNT